MSILSENSLFWLFPILGIALFMGFWLYSKNAWAASLKKRQRNLLKVLRSASIFLGLLLLLGITLKYKRYEKEAPVIITVLDNSISMLNYKDSSEVKNKYSQFRQRLAEEFEGEFELVNMVTNVEVAYSDAIDFSNGETNLSAVFERIKEDYYNRNIGGIVLISDGNYNKGTHPVYAAENINLTPTFSLYVGDTIKKRDHFIKNVSTNQIAFLNNKFPVQVDVQAFRFGNTDSRISTEMENK